MKSIAVISGKGGTGKTSVTASLAQIAGRVVVADCDVDAADLHILLHPKIIKEGTFYAGQVPSIDYEKCNKCGACYDACEYDAIEINIEIDLLACEGCGVCEFVCPQKAISMEPSECGKWFVSESLTGLMSHARLYPGKENSGKLVSLVRKNASELCKEHNLNFIFVDGPPGIGCPVIASISGVDMVLIVTEPTLSGFHDMNRVVDLADHFRIKSSVLINKSDINLGIAEQIENTCRSRGIEMLGRIPYTTEFVKAQLAGKTIVEYGLETVVEDLKMVWQRLESLLEA